MLAFLGGVIVTESEIQQIEQTKKFLRRYRKNKACINRLINKRNLLDEKIKKVKIPNYSGMPRGGIPISIDELMSDKIDLENRIKRLQNKNIKVKKEITKEIDRLDDPRYCTILESFFIDCIALEDIAEEEGYTVRHVYRLYSEAVSSLSVLRQ